MFSLNSENLTGLLFIMADREGVKTSEGPSEGSGQRRSSSLDSSGVAFGEGGTEDLRGTIV